MYGRFSLTNLPPMLVILNFANPISRTPAKRSKLPAIMGPLAKNLDNQFGISNIGKKFVESNSTVDLL